MVPCPWCGSNIAAALMELRATRTAMPGDDFYAARILLEGTFPQLCARALCWTPAWCSRESRLWRRRAHERRLAPVRAAAAEHRRQPCGEGAQARRARCVLCRRHQSSCCSPRTFSWAEKRLQYHMTTMIYVQTRRGGSVAPNVTKFTACSGLCPLASSLLAACPSLRSTPSLVSAA